MNSVKSHVLPYQAYWIFIQRLMFAICKGLYRGLQTCKRERLFAINLCKRILQTCKPLILKGFIRNLPDVRKVINANFLRISLSGGLSPPLTKHYRPVSLSPAMSKPDSIGWFQKGLMITGHMRWLSAKGSKEPLTCPGW